MAKQKKQNKKYFIKQTQSGSPASTHGGQDIKNSLSEPRTKVCHHMSKLSNKHFTNSFFFLSTDIQRRWLLAKIAAGWHCRLPIKNLTPHYITVLWQLSFLCWSGSPIMSINTSKWFLNMFFFFIFFFLIFFLLSIYKEVD